MRHGPSRLFALLGFLVVVAVGCETAPPTEPTPLPCSFALSTSALAFGTNGGSDAISVVTASQCAWTASADRGWMTIAGPASRTGAGVVTVAVTANTDTSDRSGTLTIANLPVSVRQSGTGPCPARVSPSSASFGKDAASGSVWVAAADTCTWSAVSDASWLVVTSGTPNTGDGSVTYTVERNREFVSRAAKIVIGDQTFTVVQAGDSGPAPLCDYAVAPVEFTPCMTAPAMTAIVTAGAGCTWTVEPDAPWITIATPLGGAGSGPITFHVSDNWDAPRLGIIKVRWPAVTAGQNLQIRQAGCNYAVSTSAISMPADGGTAHFDVLQQSSPYTCGGATQDRCVWTAEPDVPWITVTTPMPRAGDNPVTFVASANSGPSIRTGRILVRDKVVVITQAGK